MTGPRTSGGVRRLLLVETARGVLPPDEPEVLRLFAGLLWRLEVRSRRDRVRRLTQAALGPGRSARTAEGLVREALDVDLQRRLEELVLPRVEPGWLHRYAALHGEPGPGLLLGLTTPHPLVAIAMLAGAGGLACVAPGSGGDGAGWAARRLQRRFEEERGQFPVGWLGAAEAGSALAGGGRVYFALDGPADDLPFALAEDVAVRPVLVHRERDKRWHVAVGPAGSLAAARRAHAAHLDAWPGQTLGARKTPLPPDAGAV